MAQDAPPLANGQCEPLTKNAPAFFARRPSMALKIQGFHKFRLIFKGDDETGRTTYFIARLLTRRVNT
jgi:hypothetical protein